MCAWCAAPILAREEVNATMRTRKNVSTATWRRLLFSFGSLSAMLLAAGAKWRP
jgi:hypothetical protein